MGLDKKENEGTDEGPNERRNEGTKEGATGEGGEGRVEGFNLREISRRKFSTSERSLGENFLKIAYQGSARSAS
jgi:hypothetical protein